MKIPEAYVTNAGSAFRVLSTAAVLLVGGLALAALLIPAPYALAQVGVTESEPRDGEVLPQPPDRLRLCFTEPVRFEDSSDWRFNLRTPDGISLGLRIQFRTDGGCVDVFPGLPRESRDGTWTLSWLVRSQATGEEGSGTINFIVGEGRPTADPGGGGAAGSSGDGDAWTVVVIALAGVAGLVVVVGAGAAVVRRRRSASRG